MGECAVERRNRGSEKPHHKQLNAYLGINVSLLPLVQTGYSANNTAIVPNLKLHRNIYLTICLLGNFACVLSSADLKMSCDKQNIALVVISCEIYPTH